MAMGVLVWGTWPHGNSLEQLRTRLSQNRQLWPEILFISLLTLLAFGLRAYGLARYPAAFHGDEGEMGLMALAVLDGKPVPFFGTGWSSLPNLYFYLQAGSLALLGKNEVGLRMLSALGGTAGVPLLYLAGRIGWGRAAGMWAAILLAISHLHIHFSRMGVNNTHSVASIIAVMLLAVLAFRFGSKAPPLLYAGMGVMIGLSLYLYFGSLLLPVIAVPMLWWLWRNKQVSTGSVLLVLIGALTAYAPLGRYYLGNWEAIGARPNAVSIFNDEIVRHTLGSSASLPADLVPLLVHQFTRTLSFFTGSGDRSSFYAAEIPAFDLLTVVLFWTGILATIGHIKRFPDRAVLLWLTTGVLLAGVLTKDPPSATRLLMVVPSVFLLAGVTVQHVWDRARRITQLPWQIPAALGGFLAVGLLIMNIQNYFVHYDRMAIGLVPVSIGREMAAEPVPTAIFLAGAPHLYANHGTIQFLAGKSNPQDLSNIEEAIQAYQTGKDLLVIAIPARLSDLEKLQMQLPFGEQRDWYNRRLELLYVTFRVTHPGY
jgi:4-amino-4-deoxy-L-arabinose transferase-like glycosyltransferase